jgi:hypothetical protein
MLRAELGTPLASRPAEDAMLPGRLALALSMSAALAACESQYSYVPTTSATAIVAGRVAADYAVPRDAPRGNVRVASYGIVEVTASSAPDEYLHALQLRLIIANHSDRPWTFDTRDQRLELEGRSMSGPAFVSANLGSPPPLITIAPGGTRVVDLFFPLPTDLQDASEVPTFDALWRVDTGTVLASERTPFERLQVEPDADYGPYDYGVNDYWGPPYWYNPLYPQYAFVGGVVLSHHYIGHPVEIHRAPMGHLHHGGGAGRRHR